MHFNKFSVKLLSVVLVVSALIGIVWYVQGSREELAADSEFKVLLSKHARQRLAEAVEKAGKGPSPAERAKLRHMLMPIANHLATRFLYTEVAERARANPTKPGHQAMEDVLASSEEENKIEGMVRNKLVNIHSGEWAEEVYRKTPSKYHKLIPALATQAAHSSTAYAFKHLKEQMLAAEKNPTFLKKLSPANPNM